MSLEALNEFKVLLTGGSQYILGELTYDGPAYLLVFTNILCDISKEETVEYVLALIDEMLTVAFDFQLMHPSHPTCSIPFAVNYLANLLREPSMRVSLVQADGVSLLIPFTSIESAVHQVK
ncbi:hypothetical protein ZIOFF_047024 [Zingiber officinale]|uniref:Uncharacterized protein n=1 Tax=Zingiber officinale TaxID=94328 RepID=A0A8J5FQ71_ZINOF|nr:hypothetical protein ZIOFF_047024 [Zingiber officinale]